MVAAEDHGELLIAFDSHQVEDGPGSLEGMAEEELDGEEMNAYGALGQMTGLAEVDEELPDVFLGEFIRRSVEVPGQVLDGLDVGALGAFGQAVKAHVLYHTTAQFGHGRFLLLLDRADGSPNGSR